MLFPGPVGCWGRLDRLAERQLVLDMDIRVVRERRIREEHPAVFHAFQPGVEEGWRRERLGRAAPIFVGWPFILMLSMNLPTIFARRKAANEPSETYPLLACFLNVVGEVPRT